MESKLKVEIGEGRVFIDSKRIPGYDNCFPLYIRMFHWEYNHHHHMSVGSKNLPLTGWKVENSHSDKVQITIALEFPRDSVFFDTEPSKFYSLKRGQRKRRVEIGDDWVHIVDCQKDWCISSKLDIQIVQLGDAPFMVISENPHWPLKFLPLAGWKVEKLPSTVRITITLEFPRDSVSFDEESDDLP